MMSMKNPTRSDAPRVVAVAGAGPAGMMAAGFAALRGHRVVLLDPNGTTGKKLRITGKGRCNLTNDCTPAECLDNIPGDGRFLYSALAAMEPRATMAFFEERGVPLKTERGGRVFPASDSAFEVADALTRWLSSLGVTVQKDRVTALEVTDGALSGVKTAGGHIDCDRLVLATGGLSYPGTGCSGDGYRLAREAGHTIVPPRASLVPLVSPDPACVKMQGLSLRNVRLTVRDAAGREVFSDFGEMLFTHFGLSGPLILSASAHLRDWPPEGYVCHIDLKPALDEATLEARLLRDLTKNANKTVANALGDLLHKTMIPVIIERGGFLPDARMHSFTREQRLRLRSLLKDFPVAVSAPRPIAEAIVTAGGVALSEVVPKTMESRRVRGLFFAGELLDLDAYTGGFNLQIAWSTGVAAGCGV